MGVAMIVPAPAVDRSSDGSGTPPTRRCRSVLRVAAEAGAIVLMLGAATTGAVAHADNTALNKNIVLAVYTVQHRAGCPGNVVVSPQLRQAAQWHTDDLFNNRDLDGHTGSDGSTPADRAAAAGFRGRVVETVAMAPTWILTGNDVMNQWFYDPAAHAIMADCANTVMGVWSQNSFDRSVLVAVYGQPE